MRKAATPGRAAAFALGTSASQAACGTSGVEVNGCATGPVRAGTQPIKARYSPRNSTISTSAAAPACAQPIVSTAELATAKYAWEPATNTSPWAANSQPTNETMIAAPPRQYGWRAMITRPNSSVNTPVTNDNTGSASNFDSIARISSGRKATTAAIMTMYGPITRANMRVLFWSWVDDSIAFTFVRGLSSADDNRYVLLRDG